MQELDALKTILPYLDQLYHIDIGLGIRNVKGVVEVCVRDMPWPSSP
jgi:hypothetical protein